MRDVLNWLPLRQRIEFRVAVLVWYSLIGQASAYLADLCCPSLSIQSTRHLYSAEQSHLLAPPPCTIFRGWPFGMEWSPIGSLVVTRVLGYSPRNSFSKLKQHYLSALAAGSASE